MTLRDRILREKQKFRTLVSNKKRIADQQRMKDIMEARQDVDEGLEEREFQSIPYDKVSLPVGKVRLSSFSKGVKQNLLQKAAESKQTKPLARASGESVVRGVRFKKKFK